MDFIEVEKVVRDIDWSMQGLHSHSHYELYYLAEGERTIFLTNELFSISAPCFISIPPNVLHKTEGGAYKRYNINVDSKYLNDFQAAIINKLALTIVVPNDTSNRSFIEILEKMSDVKKSDKYYNEKINALFSYFVYSLNIKNDEKTILPIPSISDTDASVMKIIKYINDNFAENITLDMLSRMHYTSKPKLIKDFKKITNASPIDYLLKIRLTHAKCMLSTTKKPISKISEECGFSSSNYFCYIFKKKLHMSPTDFRQCYR